MTNIELEQLVQSAGLNLLTTWSPRFGVSLHVPKSYGSVNGTRIQNGTITFASQKAFSAATTEETQVAIDEIKRRLERASRTKQGDVAQGGEVKVVTKQDSAPVAQTIKYPAH